MGRWRECGYCEGTGDIFRGCRIGVERCPRCEGVGQLPPDNELSNRERRLAADHPHDPPHTGCPACVADDPFLGANT